MFPVYIVARRHWRGTKCWRGQGCGRDARAPRWAFGESLAIRYAHGRNDHQIDLLAGRRIRARAGGVGTPLGGVEVRSVATNPCFCNKSPTLTATLVGHPLGARASRPHPYSCKQPSDQYISVASTHALDVGFSPHEKTISRQHAGTAFRTRSRETIDESVRHPWVHWRVEGYLDPLSGFPKTKIMKHRLYYFPMLLTFVVAAPAFGAQEGSQPPTCEDSSIVASAVRTEEDIRVFVQCAYEFAQQEGLEEARRAFNQDARWKSGPSMSSSPK